MCNEKVVLKNGNFLRAIFEKEEKNFSRENEEKGIFREKTRIKFFLSNFMRETRERIFLGKLFRTKTKENNFPEYFYRARTTEKIFMSHFSTKNWKVNLFGEFSE